MNDMNFKSIEQLVGQYLRKFPPVFRVAQKAYSISKLLRLLVLGKPGAFNYLRCFFSALLRKEISHGRPVLLSIEPTNICDQRCTICETGLGILERKPQSMSFAQFKEILDPFDENLKTLYFYFMGESFLNKDAYKMIRYAADRGIFVSACTNGNRVDAEQLVKSGIADIQFQISGTTPESHAQYRVGGDLDRCLANLREVIRLRNLAGKALDAPFGMRVGLGFILLKPNEHQQNDFIKMAQNLGVDAWQIIDPCVRTVEQGKDLLPEDKKHWIYDIEAFQKGELKPKSSPDNYCEWLYSTVTIQVNGDVVPCCRDPKGKWILGNVFEDDIYKIWNGPKYRALRRAVATRQKELTLCRLCEGYSLPEYFK